MGGGGGGEGMRECNTATESLALACLLNLRTPSAYIHARARKHNYLCHYFF